ncbi:MAG: intradiol ring-cleavage dioxygenase [Proteobacteria bacterium]|nr:intradiol ring-cleavage dioxygenase [Pseudomonadota bacterium]MBU1687254.1 intradiol ring-cleavage dioxygenase [Pseudomonadota bacterium]
MTLWKELITIIGLLLIGLVLTGCNERRSAERTDCLPTPYDEIGPFYRPGAPVRQAVGKGYVLSGMVLSTDDCRLLPGARLEFWLVNPQGEYDDAHRATVYADRKGWYHFESNRPIDYVGRLPHIHMMVTADGQEQLITQHYPTGKTSGAVFDLVLVPVAKP